MTLIHLRNVSRIYTPAHGPEVHALRDVSLEIDEGEFIAIVGPSGGGKSTLLNLLGLLDDPSSGEYLLAGRRAGRVNRSAAARLRSRHIAFIFQAFHLLERRPAIDSVGLNLLYRGVALRQRQEESVRALAAVGLKDAAWQNASTLSGGQRQRIAIARAMAGDARLVLADEPTGNLDSVNTELVLDELERVNRRGAAVVIVTHSPEVAARAGRVIRISDGAVVSDTRSSVPREASESMQPRHIAATPGDARTFLRVTDMVADAWASIASRKTQTLAQCVAVVIAVALSIITLGLSASADAQVSETFDAHLNREVTARWATGLPSSNPLADAPSAARAVAGVEAAAVVVDLAATAVSTDSVTAQVQPHMVVGDLEEAARVDIDEAPWHRGALQPGEAYIGDLLARDLELGDIALAPTVQVAGERYVVAGLITESARLPLLRGELLLGADAPGLDSLAPEATLLVTTLAGAAPQVASQLARAINPFAPDEISVVAPSDDSRLRVQIEAGVQATLIAFTLLALLVAIAALVNTTLMAVNARRAEIGMRKALGAKERDIGILIAVESVYIGVLGGIGGLFVGMMAIIAVTISQRWAPVFDVMLMPLAVLLGVVVSSAGGALASVRAARLRPAENLRAS
ncbi:ABC transporter ATP-binding protein/permease [Microbacterium sp. 1S1]|uniref:ABC transporter ATP-binding protein/permease n=1 Tax=Microbacterium sp. 1S1 TaxID=2606451 RepID=UPI0011EB5EB0|nr:ABC transporter ATP-binding protein/permease [Microbacterium sp. 1S1]